MFCRITQTTRRDLRLVCLAAVVLLSVAAARGHAADPARSLEALVDETTFLILKVQPGQVDLPAAETLLPGDVSPRVKKRAESLLQGLVGMLKRFKTASGGGPLYAIVGIPGDEQTVPLRVVRKRGKQEQEFAALVDQFDFKQPTIHGDWLVAAPAGPASSLRPPAKATNETFAALDAAFQSAAEFPLQVVVVPPAHVWRTFREFDVELPDQLGGGPTSVLTEGAQWMSFGLDPRRLKAEVTIQSATPAAAAKLAENLPKMLTALAARIPQDPSIPAGIPALLIRSLNPLAEGNQVKIKFDGQAKTAANLALLLGIAQSLADTAEVSSDQRSLKQLLLGMHNYHDVFRSFPPAQRHRDKDGKPRLSWRVHILPFIEQAELYDRFHLDEPWDSDHNKKLIEKMPAIFAAKSLDPDAPRPKPGHTTFVAPIGKGTVFGGRKPTRFQNILDGTSNTVVLVRVKASEAVPWTAPDDYKFKPADPLAGVAVGPRQSWIAAFGDGSVRTLPAKLPSATVVSLFQMNDGKVIRLP